MESTNFCTGSFGSKYFGIKMAACNDFGDFNEKNIDS
jgi:hypothetical protein